MAQRNSKAAQHGVFQNNPPRIQRMIDGYTQLYKKLTDDDQKLFSTNVLIMITGHEYKDLQHNQEIIVSSLKRNSMSHGYLKYQQRDGLKDVLPCGSHRAFQFRRSLNTEAVAIFQPFNVKEVQQRDSIYYGLNVLSDNIITFNRLTSLINPSGFVLGCPGSGKSFTAKREMIDVFLRYKDADIMIIDPEREYGALVNSLGGSHIKISTGSTNFINPFEFDLSLLDTVIDDERVDVLGDKSNLITGFISAMDTKNPLGAQENSFIDSCVQKAYAPLFTALEENDYKNLPSNEVALLKQKYMPTLGTLFDVMTNEENVDPAIKNRLLLTLQNMSLVRLLTSTTTQISTLTTVLLLMT
jgi:type IV secretory pathway VirB4 component